MQWIQRLAFVLAIAVFGGASFPTDAASKYKACSLLTAPEIEAAVQAKVTGTTENDLIILEGSFKGETMSQCTWAAGTGAAFVMVNILRGPRTPQERAEGLALFRSTEEKLKKQGWTAQEVSIAGVTCSTLKPPATVANAYAAAACGLESKGLAFAVSIASPSNPTAEQAKALADKVATRLP